MKKTTASFSEFLHGLACSSVIILSNMMQQRLNGLKSRSDDSRLQAAKDLQHYVSTELREASAEQYTSFMDELNHHIFEMVSSSDANEKKGGIMAIGE